MAWKIAGAPAAAGLIALAAGAAAASPPGGIAVSGAWSRPTPKGLPTGVAYMTLTNRAAFADRLTGASTRVAQRMELHRSSMTHGVMSMAAVPDGLEIPARGHAALVPGGGHFMLIGLKQGLRPGTTFPVSLSFAHAGRVTVEVAVRTTAPEPPMAGMDMH